MAARTRRFLLAAAATAAALGVAELGARRLYGDGFASVVDLYEHHPYRPFARYRDTSGLEVVTNSLGWKDASPRFVAKTASRPRVVVLGDSFVEGLGLRDEESVPRLLESALRRLGRDVEVLNGGRVSFCPLLEYQRLKRFLAAGYHADCVVVLPDLSDVQDELDYREQFVTSEAGEPIRLKGAIANPLLRGAYNGSALLRMARRGQLLLTGRLPPAAVPAFSSTEDWRVAARELAAIPRTGELADLQSVSGATRRVLRANWMLHPPSLRGWAGRGLRSLQQNLERIATLCRRREISVFAAIYPWPQLTYGPHDRDRYEALGARFGPWFRERELVAGRAPSPRPSAYESAVLETCEQVGLRCVDLVDDFAADPRWERFFQPGDVHLTAQGNRVIAEALAAALDEDLRVRRPVRARALASAGDGA
jgi:hypothetical protein